MRPARCNLRAAACAAAHTTTSVTCLPICYGRPNPNTHAYSHRDLVTEEHLVADQPKPGAELIIRHPEERFVRRQDRVTKFLELAGAMKMEKELLDNDADDELNGDLLLISERVAAALPGNANRWVTWSSVSLPAIISSGLSCRPLEC